MPRGIKREGCAVEGCDRIHYGRGWCQAHYLRWYLTGNVDSERSIGVRMRTHVIQHGTQNEYGNYGCRCAECRAAHAEHSRATKFNKSCIDCGATIWDQARLRCRPCAVLARTKPLIHGTENGYTKKGCRCVECTAAATQARRRLRQLEKEEA